MPPNPQNRNEHGKGRLAERNRDGSITVAPGEQLADEDLQRDPLIDELEEQGAELKRWLIGRDSSQRLDKYLQSRVGGLSRNQVQRLIKLGGVTVNGELAKPSRALKEGDAIEVVVPPRPAEHLEPEEIPIGILYEDDGFVIVNKPANLIVHPAKSYRRGTLLNALAWHFQQQAQAGAQAGGLSNVGEEDARPGVVHRLDMNTTGCIVVAKQDAVHWLLARQFEERTNTKAYLAVVHGCPEPPSGAIEQPLGKHPTIREAFSVRRDHQGKHSLTLYRVRERYEGYSLVELDLKTGRTHQIRVHLSFLGHPIVGDLVYGGEMVGPKEIAAPPRPAAAMPFVSFARTKEEGRKLEAIGVERRQPDTSHPDGPAIMTTPALHAAYLELTHPVTGQRLKVTAPVHEPMATLIRELRKRPAPGPVVHEGTYTDLQVLVPPPPVA